MFKQCCAQANRVTCLEVAWADLRCVCCVCFGKEAGLWGEDVLKCGIWCISAYCMCYTALLCWSASGVLFVFEVSRLKWWFYLRNSLPNSSSMGECMGLRWPFPSVFLFVQEPDYLRYQSLYVMTLDDILNNNMALQAFIGNHLSFYFIWRLTF